MQVNGINFQIFKIFKKLSQILWTNISWATFLGLNLGYSHFVDHKHQLCFLNDPS